MEENKNVPIFDPAAIRKMSEEEIDAYGKAYTHAVDAYVRESVAESLAPVIEDLESKEQEQTLREAVSDLKENADYYDFSDQYARVRELCESLPALQGAEPRQGLTMAYLMIKGAEALSAHKNPPVREAAEIAEEIWANPEVMKLLALRRAEEADEDLPVFARSGTGVMAAEQTPKTLSDASSQARKHFHI